MFSSKVVFLQTSLTAVRQNEQTNKNVYSEAHPSLWIATQKYDPIVVKIRPMKYLNTNKLS